VSTSASILQEETSIDEFFNVMATETLALFEHLEFDFLEEFDVFAPARRGRTRDHHPPALFRAFLHCYYKNVYGIRPVTRELQNTVVWLSQGFDRPPSRDAVDRFLTDLEHVVDEVFDRLVEQAACRGLLDLTYSIDSTDVRTMPADQDASKGYDPTAEEYYHGYGCTIVSTGQKIPIAAEFTESKQAPEETAMRVTCDALAVEKPIWMLGDSAYDTLGWHDHLLAAGVVPVAPYNARNTDDPKDIEYRVEARIDEHSEDVRAEAIDARRDVQPPEWSRTNQRRRQGLRPRARSRPRPRPRTSTSVPRAVPSSRYCDHQRRTRRQSRKHRHHAMRTIL